jgi:hypothetical protein
LARSINSRESLNWNEEDLPNVDDDGVRGFNRQGCLRASTASVGTKPAGGKRPGRNDEESKSNEHRATGPCGFWFESKSGEIDRDQDKSAAESPHARSVRLFAQCSESNVAGNERSCESQSWTEPEWRKSTSQSLRREFEAASGKLRQASRIERCRHWRTGKCEEPKLGRT